MTKTLETDRTQPTCIILSFISLCNSIMLANNLILHILFAVSGVVQAQVPSKPSSICYGQGAEIEEVLIFCRQVMSHLPSCFADGVDPFDVQEVLCIMQCEEDEVNCEDYGLECYDNLSCIQPLGMIEEDNY